MSKRTQSSTRRLALMPAGFAEIERVECLHSLIGKILSDSRCTLTNHELTVASSERGQELPLWIVLMWAWSVGYGAWTTGGRRSGSNDTRLAHVLHYVSAGSSRTLGSDV